MIDKGESTRSKTILTLLDWEKAFDKVWHDELMEALARMGIPDKLINIITDCYSKAEFMVEMDGKKSEWKKQKTGIRQGCPLSPYLFVIFMTVLFHDIHQGDQLKMKQQRVVGTQADEVLYADDAICIAQNERAMNRLLAAIETEGAKYGMKLNRSKCEVLGFGEFSAIKFQDGTLVKRKEEVKYLGCLLNDRGDNHKEIINRIAVCTGILNRMHIFFRHGDCSIRVKLSVYDAVIRSKLMYGLETTALNSSCLKRLDAFQMKGLRKIVGAKSTYIDRSAANAKVMEMAQAEANRE